MTRRPTGLLARPAPAAAALVGLTLLDEARAACGRLDAPEDAEALHDFRVALRRLRTVLRSFRPELGDAVAKKLQRRLRDVTRATSAGRDAEVQLAWVRSHRPEPGRRSGPGLPWLLTRLEDRQNRAYVDIRQEIPPEFRQIERRVRRGLNAALVDASPGAPAFAAATGRLLREQTAMLEQELETARSTRDQDAVHAARVAVKRLRYLLEPIAAERPPRAGALVELLKRLQNVLGELHDLQVLLAELGVAVAEAAAERARHLHAAALAGAPGRRPGKRTGPRPASAGLLALARFAGRFHDELFRRLDAEWAAEPLATLTQDLRAFADELVTVVVPPARLPPPRRTRAHPARSRARPRATEPQRRR
ncbi:MAG: hypothetical protein AUH81_06605 [Candidatus Rokubacteria bacterium 13_1_40CM_4_69_5]|nr:MAG: hypothetical protein AUH81_06605 [Candidatus Rokubacteria bacterium 13_1_40CM_4_69_5]